MATQSTRSMVSETSICNQGLSWVGANRIDSLEDQTTEAEWCRDNYPFIRDAVLEEAYWTFAADRAVSSVSDKDGWDDMYSHQIPLSWIKVLRIYRDTNKNRIEGWMREGRSILAKESTIYMTGVVRITDTGYFSPMFVQALALRLAAEMAVPLTESISNGSFYLKKYGAALAEAKSSDGQQAANEMVQSNSLIDARAGGYGTR